MTTAGKPRMRRERGVWICSSPVYQGLIIAWRIMGFGLTPRDAYDSWAGRNKQ